MPILMEKDPETGKYFRQVYDPVTESYKQIEVSDRELNRMSMEKKPAHTYASSEDD